MSDTTNFLETSRRIMKLRESVLKKICDQYELTMIQGNIITFLYNNPGKDTATDIVELRMLSKGNVSRAVEELIQKKLLKRELDKKDRRVIHLLLLPSVDEIIEQIKKEQEKFQKEIYRGFSEEEMEIYLKLNERMRKNILYMTKGESKE